MSAAAFCKENQVNLQSFYAWRRRFNSESGANVTGAFVELVPSCKIQDSGIRIRLGGRVSVDLDPIERAKSRQFHAAPVIDAIFARLEELKGTTIPSEPLRKAVDYTLNQREALCRYLGNGWLKPDNNTSENAIRPLCLGRKNWLFAGSERGARATALFLGLIQSCKACNVNPWEYFDDILRRIMGHPINHLRELLPDQWKPLPKDDHGLIIQPH